MMFLLGILFGLKYYYALAGAFCLSFIIFKNRFYLNKKNILKAVFLIGIFIIGLFFSKLQNSKYEELREFISTQKSINIQGEIYKKEYKNEKIRLYIRRIKCDEFGDSCFNGMIFSKEDFEIGDTIRVHGEIMPENPVENEGGFDYEKYLKSKKIAFRITPHSQVLLDRPGFCVKNSLYKSKQRIIEFYDYCLPNEESGILSSIVLGEKTELDEDAKEMFSKAGLSHILAVSGLHLSVVGAGLYSLLRKIGLSFSVSGIFSGFVVMLYGILCGNPVSLTRAIVMFLVSVLANITGRAYDMISSLSLAAIILLCQNPFIVADSGFVMSFSAILGICVFSKPITDRFYNYCKNRWRQKDDFDYDSVFRLNPWEKLVNTFLFTISIQIFMYPIVAFYFNRIPMYVVLVNILVLPLLAGLLFIGLISGLLFFSPGIYICHYVLFYYEMVADFVSNLAGSTLILATPRLYVFIVYYLVLAGFIFMLNNTSENRVSIKLCLGTGTLAILLLIFLCLQRPSGFRIDMLSVGQGDGIFIQSKENISFFVDGGSSDRKEVGKYVIEPYLKAMGVGHIDYWMLTHLDDDHINGCLELLDRGYDIKNLCIPTVFKTDEKMGEIKKLCKENNTKINYICKGDSLGTKTLKISILYPDIKSNYSDSNDNSLCFLLEYKDFQAVFTGDIGIPQEEEILRNYSFPKGIELLKVAHHGSKNSSGEAWIKAVSPEYAIISAGANNKYGHPSKETIKRFEDARIKHYCTFDVGRIRIRDTVLSTSLCHYRKRTPETQGFF